MTPKPFLTALALTFIMAALAPSARATSVRGMSADEQVLRADVVALVECTAAGGVVAQYRVVTTYKGGPKPGDTVRLRVPPDPWEPQFPLALVGERYVIAAVRESGAARRRVAGGPIPLWWRDQHADYTLPLFHGRTQWVGGTPPVTILGGTFASLDAFAARVRELAALAPADQELLVMRAILEGLVPDAQDPEKGLFQRALAADSAAGLLGALRAGPSSGRGPNVASMLEAAAPLRREAEVPPYEPPAPPAMTGAQVDAYLAALADPRSDDFHQALTRLTAERPEAIAAALLTWKRPNAEWYTADTAARLGSHFAFRCPPAARKALLPRLAADAHDPSIRVAAAIYWALDEEKPGTARLAELMNLPGDPGAWAALALASRGDKEALARAAALLEDLAPDTGMAGVPRRNLQRRLLVLLSNSAAASNLPQPPYDTTADVPTPATADWYRQHRAALKLHDPWFADLASHRVD